MNSSTIFAGSYLNLREKNLEIRTYNRTPCKPLLKMFSKFAIRNKIQVK